VRFYLCPDQYDTHGQGAVCRSVAEAADQKYSYVVVTTKAVPDVIKTPQILAPLLSKEYINRFPQPTYVLIQNGLNVEVDLYNSIKALDHGEPSIVSTALWIGANLLSPNLVEHNDFVSYQFHQSVFKSFIQF